MALVFLESFDGHAAHTLPPGKYLSFNAGFSAGRTGNAALFGGSSASRERVHYDPSNWGVATEILVGFALRFTENIDTASEIQILSFDTADGVAWEIRRETSSNQPLRVFRVESDGTRTLTDSIPSAFNDVLAWHYWEVRLKVDDVAGELEITIDGQLVTDLTGIDTRRGGGAATDITRLAFGVSSDNLGGELALNHARMQVDDLYVVTPAGAEPTDFYRAPVHVPCMRPTGAGAYAEWTRFGDEPTNWESVEDPTRDDTDYVEADVDGERDSYLHGDLPAAYSSYSVEAVATTIVARHTGTTVHDIAVRSKDGADERTMGTVTPENSFGWHQVIDSLAPDGLAWTPAKVDAAEFGYRREA